MRQMAAAVLIGSITLAGCNRTSSPAVTDVAAQPAAPAVRNAEEQPKASRTTAVDSTGNPEGVPAEVGAPQVRAVGDIVASGPVGAAPSEVAGLVHGDAAPARETDTVSRPAWREVTIPAGTTLPILLDTPVASDVSREEQPVHAHLSRAVTIGGLTVLPRGTAVSGVVTDVVRSGKVSGRAHLAIRFDTLATSHTDERYRIETATVARTAPGTKKQDTVKILAPAAGGAVIGRIAGGRKGAAIGGGIGAGAGTAVVMSTRGQEVRLRKGTVLTLKLVEPLTVRVRT